MSIEIAYHPDDAILDRVSDNELALREEIKRLLGSWLHVCNVNTPIVKVYWTHGAGKDRANCGVDHQYDELHFEFNVGRIIGELNDEELFEEICHEAAHSLNAPLWRIADQLVERVASTGVAEGELKKWRDDIEDAGELSTTRTHRALLRAWRLLPEEFGVTDD